VPPLHLDGVETCNLVLSIYEENITSITFSFTSMDKP
jgi:hypothetical protein